MFAGLLFNDRGLTSVVEIQPMVDQVLHELVSILDASLFNKCYYLQNSKTGNTIFNIYMKRFVI